ncbi:MAG: hypothetical protein U0746_00165 [Gemmataceae bacterium]
MRLRSIVVLGALTIGFALPARAADPAEPTVVLRFKSIDGMIADAKYVLGLAGQGELGKQLEALIDSQAGPKGLVGTGLDTKKPFGVYVNVGAAGVDSTGAILIPVADEKAFVAFLGEQLETKGVKLSRGSDGVYTLTSDAAPVSAFLGFSEGYAYVTVIDKDPIAGGKRLSPAKIFPANDTALIGLTARLDRIPDLLKQLGFGLLENRLADHKEAQPGESEAVTKKRGTAIDQFAECLKGWIDQAGTLSIAASVDRKSEELAFDASLTGKPGTDLAASIQGLSTATTRSLGNGLAGEFGVNIAIPDKMREATAIYVETLFKDAMSKEKDVVKKALLRKAFDAVLPTIKAGQVNIMAGLNGPKPDGKYSLLLGMQLAEEKKVEGLVKEMYPSVPPEIREKIKLDAETIAGTPVHIVNAPNDLTPDIRRVFGDSATVQIAFPKEMVVIGLGNDASAVLKSVLTDTGRRPAPPMSVEGSIVKLAPLDRDNAGAAVKVAKEVFGSAASGSDAIRVSIQGGSSLHFRASVKGLALKYAGMLKDEVGGK